MFRRVPTAWREYRRRSMVASLGLVLGLPAVFAVSIALKLWPVHDPEGVFILLVILWAIFWGGSAIRLVRWPCPRCGKPWLANQEAALGATRCCAHCGLALYESP